MVGALGLMRSFDALYHDSRLQICSAPQILIHSLPWIKNQWMQFLEAANFCLQSVLTFEHPSDPEVKNFGDKVGRMDG